MRKVCAQGGGVGVSSQAQGHRPARHSHLLFLLERKSTCWGGFKSQTAGDRLYAHAQEPEYASVGGPELGFISEDADLALQCARPCPGSGVQS